MANTITLLGALQAKVGDRFLFSGPNNGPDSVCAPCKLQGTCFNLDPGETYEVQQVREKGHPCFLHEGGVVRVVEVAPAKHDAILPSRGLVAGQLIVYPERECENRGCEMWRNCVGGAPRPGGSYHVESVGPTVDCPLGFALRSARLAPK